MSGPTRFRRILLKVSGEAFSRGGTRPVEPEGVGALADEVAAARALGVQVAALPGQDHVTIAVAQRLEEALGGWVAPPPLRS